MPFNPEMLSLARESRSLTQMDLAAAIGVSQGKISKYELGYRELSAEDQPKISKVLDYPEDFFFQGDSLYGLSDVYYRRRQSLSSAERKTIEAQANVIRMRVTRLLRSVEIQSPNQFPKLEIDCYDGGPEEIARRVRADWHLPQGPVRSVTATIESAGGFVFRRRFGDSRLDAVIQCPNGLCALFFVNSSIAAGDRLRFTLAHEIGHVVMRNTFSPNPEAEADRFSAEFLMPEKEIAGELDDFSLSKAIRLKPYWKVSIQALVRRAYSLGKIDQRKYRHLSAQISSSGWRKNEPEPVAIEVPSLVNDVIDTCFQKMGYTYQSICKLLHSSEADFRQQFCSEEPHRRGFGLVGCG